MLAFCCNVCGNRVEAPHADIRDREKPSCPICGSNLRFRTMMAGLSQALFGSVLPVTAFPVCKTIRGVGLSDAESYAGRLRDKLDYTNTFFHRKPFLDITSVGDCEFRDLDFMISSDVFEHVAPPVASAFTNARRLLKDGGVLVLSVPFIPGETDEHFPELHAFRLEERGGSWTLYNRTTSGAEQVFTDLVFHGGPGATLEMRLFGLDGLRRALRESRFSEPVLLDEHRPAFGIDWRGEICSIPLVATAV